MEKLRQKDTLALPFGNGRFAPISSEDQGRVIAAILLDPAPHAGRLYELLGPVELDGFGIAAAISEALGRAIRYSPIEVDAFLETLRKIPAYSAPFFTQHIGAVSIDCRNGVTGGTNDNVERLTGAPSTQCAAIRREAPGSLRAYLRTASLGGTLR